jgi:hypothetical protein
MVEMTVVDWDLLSESLMAEVSDDLMAFGRVGR